MASKKASLRDFFVLGPKSVGTPQGGLSFDTISERDPLFAKPMCKWRDVPRVLPEYIATAGRGMTDVLGGIGPLLVSRRFVDFLETAKYTGWKAFPVKLKDKKGSPIKEKYFGLGILGRAGPLDQKRSRVERSSPEIILTMKGIYFDPSTWDGSDFFLLQDLNANLVAGRVIEGLTAAKLTGWEATPLAKYGF